MIFSSIPFLYYFLPIVIILYFVVPKKLANGVLLLASLFFYGYGEPKMLFVMIATIVISWLLGLVIPKNKVFCCISMIVSLGVLIWFKYMNFFVESFNADFGLSIEFAEIALPAGISFYTFQILSYTIDLYRGKIAPQKSLINFATYVALFPQLIAGPIVVYSAVESQLDPMRRETTWEDLYDGIRRFTIGLGKKIILANNLAQFVQIFNGLGQEQRSIVMYWAYGVAFTLQIYFDFSGYSDMAIGLGRIFGFSFPENFNYPFISKSITEFWRRWHMTLGSWFREYVYIPLGGNRVGKGHWIFNILVVWALTGLWHGANWTFLAWGLYFAVFLMIEKLWLGKVLDKLPSILGHIYTLIAVIFSMVLFNGDTIGDAAAYMSAMLGIGSHAGVSAGNLIFINEISSYYLRSYGMLFIFSFIGATPVLKNLKFAEKLEPLICIVLLLLATAYLVDGSYNPFLYFRF